MKTNKKYNIKGFSLIELMITISIIGILAAIAIPAYGDYLTRARVSELITSAAPAKNSVTEYILFNSSDVISEVQATGLGSYTVMTSLINSISIGENGVITVEGNPAKLGVSNANDAVFNIQLTPSFDTTSRAVLWECGPDPDNTTGTGKFLPSSCQ